MAVENEARMETAAGAEEELKGCAAWQICQEVQGLRQDLRADRDRTDRKAEALRLETTDKIDGLRQEMKEEFTKVRQELKGLKSDLRWVLGAVLTILVPIAVAMLRLAFK